MGCATNWPEARRRRGSRCGQQFDRCFGRRRPCRRRGSGGRPGSAHEHAAGAILGWFECGCRWCRWQWAGGRCRHARLRRGCLGGPGRGGGRPGGLRQRGTGRCAARRCPGRGCPSSGTGLTGGRAGGWCGSGRDAGADGSPRPPHARHRARGCRSRRGQRCLGVGTALQPLDSFGQAHSAGPRCPGCRNRKPERDHEQEPGRHGARHRHHGHESSPSSAGGIGPERSWAGVPAVRRGAASIAPPPGSWREPFRRRAASRPGRGFRLPRPGDFP